MRGSPESAESKQSWRPLLLALAVFVALIGGTLISTLFRDDTKNATVFSTTELNGTGAVQVGLGCEVRGRTLQATTEYRVTGAMQSFAFTFGDGTEPRVVQVEERRIHPRAVYRYDKPGRYVVTVKIVTDKAVGEDSCTVTVR